MLLTCDDAWFGGWRGPSALTIEAGRLRYAGPADALASDPGSDPGSDPDSDPQRTESDGHLRGVVLAPFTDSHVHLGLIDAGALVAGGIGRVVDLGWDPAQAKSWPNLGADPESGWPEVSIAGPLLGAPGGYPSRSAWAPAAAAVAVATSDDAKHAIDDVRAGGASIVKITLNSDAGPVWSDETLDAVVGVAHDAGLPVVAHAQGLGQTRRAARARVDALAHTPFSERLDDDLLDDFARSMTWISTLAIHARPSGANGQGGDAYDIAVDNLARFHARGGSVLYGTDLGNGELPLGLNGIELAGLSAAGLTPDAVLSSLTPGSGEPGYDTRLVTWMPDRPATIADLAISRILTLPALVREAE